MLASRHRSVGAQLTYLASDNRTEQTKLKALGFNKPGPVSVAKLHRGFNVTYDRKKTVEEVEEDMDIEIHISLSQKSHQE